MHREKSAVVQDDEPAEEQPQQQDSPRRSSVSSDLCECIIDDDASAEVPLLVAMMKLQDHREDDAAVKDVPELPQQSPLRDSMSAGSSLEKNTEPMPEPTTVETPASTPPKKILPFLLSGRLAKRVIHCSRDACFFLSFLLRVPEKLSNAKAI
jgi:hypothetical protein